MAEPKERRSIEKDPSINAMFRELLKQGKTDQQIVDILLHQTGYPYSLKTVQRTRRRSGVEKQARGKHVDKDTGLTLNAPPPTGSDAVKSEWYRKRFRASHLYVGLLDQFDEREIGIYMEEYGQVCTQFEDIVVSEYFQIDDFLKHRILINRQLTRMKSIQAELSETQKWFLLHPVKEDEDKDLKRQRIENYRLLEGTHTALNKSNDRYDKLVAERQKIYQNLAATRRDRIDELKTGGDNFFGLLAAISTSDKARQQHGKYAELTRLAAEDVHKKFREPTIFPDGSKDVVILDENSEVVDEIAQLENEEPSKETPAQEIPE